MSCNAESMFRYYPDLEAVFEIRCNYNQIS